MILFDRTSSYHDVTSAFFREAGVVPRGVMELDNIDATKKMVRQGLGVAMVPKTAVAEELEAGTLHAVHIVDAPPVRRQIVADPPTRRGPCRGPCGRVPRHDRGHAAGAPARRDRLAGPRLARTPKRLPRSGGRSYANPALKSPPSAAEPWEDHPTSEA